MPCGTTATVHLTYGFALLQLSFETCEDNKDSYAKQIATVYTRRHSPEGGDTLKMERVRRGLQRI